MTRTASRLAAIGLLAATGQCAHFPTEAPSAAVCAQWRGITWSRKDTPITVDQVKANNARRQGWCA